MRRGFTIPSVDPFLIWLVGVVTAASLLPARGAFASVFEMLADAAIALLFFLQGAKLSREAILQGLGKLKLHLLALASTYVLFPLTGIAIDPVLKGFMDPALVTGVLFLTLLPSTVQSSVAFTAIARGNVAAAVCGASISNFLGIFITPLLVGIFIASSKTGQGFDWGAVQSITLQLLVPFLAGHFLRPLIGSFVDKHKKMLQPVDRGSILMVVYSAFSAAVVDGIWNSLGISDLLLLLLVSAVILAIVMVANAVIARIAGLPREDFIVLLFCGSKKSLASGVPMAGALFAPAQVGMVVIPLMIFHQLQLFVCAWLAGRFAKQGEVLDAPKGDTIPRSADEIALAAKGRGIAIPAECEPGVESNLALLARHAATLRGELP